MIEIFDTTLRDGTQQEGISYSTEDKIHITQKLDELGLDYVEGGWPGSNPKDIEYFEKVKSLDLENTTVVAFGSTRRPGLSPEEDRNLEALINAGVEAVAIFGKSWDLHVTDALDTTPDENLKMIASSVKFLKSRGLEVIFDAEHFFDGFDSDSDYALEAVSAAEDAGADRVVLCDTNGGFLPGDIRRIYREVKEVLSSPPGIHPHNDTGLAVANALAAVEEGARHVQGSINGYGERCGNANLCHLIPNLQIKKGYEVLGDGDLSKLTPTARYVSEIGNLNPPTSDPFVGESAFAHKGGIHVSAVMKNPETYEHIDPEIVGNERRVLVSELSGKSNLQYKAEELGIELEDGEESREILDRIKKLEHKGYNFEGAEASFKLLIDRMRGEYQRLFTLEKVRILTDKKGEGKPISEAVIKVSVRGEQKHTAAEGVGPVNALDKALRKALIEFYPSLESLYLIDYKVRVIDGSDGTAAKVRVLIKTGNGTRSWGTVGVSTNIIEASWRAVVDSIEYGIRLERKENQGELVS
ncbi:citramalate synthase [Halarsenatibacter silvermanii]|uniref:Citramalate synthase n=1 Tax=Halarsenatibacter silvermanii TaxID=321763 RepID=A0A1G9QTB2_9FIRM|nr:citramalate synthase [Halarsenatibacter silvermanii]SDM14279.1 (R)-citramalate synthase [Halarsenatibacter silvermanii]